MTSRGGEAITLAGSGAGRVTSFAGSEFTALTSAVSAAASNNAAVGVFTLNAPLLAGLLAVAGGTLVGAVLTI